MATPAALSPRAPRLDAGATPAALVVFGHRGAPREACENTLESFARALDAGADVLELDLRATRDGHLVVLHGANLAEVGDVAAEVGSLSLAEVQRVALRPPATAPRAAPGRVPTFVEFLDAFPQASCNVDLKEADPRWARVLLSQLDAARARGAGQGHFVLTSFHDAQLDALRAAPVPNVRFGVGRRDVLRLLANAYLGVPSVAHLRGRVVQVPVWHHVAGVALPVVTDRFVARVKALGCPLHVWWDRSEMVDDAGRARALHARGVDGVFTNDVRALVRALRPKKARAAQTSP